jgi:hypothetical protein
MTINTYKRFDGYKGWSNRETWVINSWMGNYFQQIAKEGQQNMAFYIEQSIWGMFVDAEVPPMFADMIDMDSINWRELAAHYMTEAEVKQGAV